MSKKQRAYSVAVDEVVSYHFTILATSEKDAMKRVKEMHHRDELQDFVGASESDLKFSHCFLENFDE